MSSDEAFEERRSYIVRDVKIKTAEGYLEHDGVLSKTEIMAQYVIDGKNQTITVQAGDDVKIVMDAKMIRELVKG